MAEQQQESLHPTERELYEALKDLKQWELFGMHLKGMKFSAITKIDSEHQNIEAKKTHLYDKWLRVCPDASWEDVVAALHKIDENRIASQVEKQHVQRSAIVINGTTVNKETMKPMSTTAPADSGIPDGDDVDWYSSAVSPTTTGIETPSSIHLHTAASTVLKDVSTQTEEDKKYNKHRKESIETQALLTDTLKITTDTLKITGIISQGKKKLMETEEDLEKTIDEKDKKIEKLEKQVKDLKQQLENKIIKERQIKEMLQ